MQRYENSTGIKQGLEGILESVSGIWKLPENKRLLEGFMPALFNLNEIEVFAPWRMMGY